MKKSLTASKIVIFFCIFLFIILRIPSLYEPHWYGDEGVYAGVAYAMENGRTLYTEVWDNKPPAIYFLYMLGNTENRLLVIRVLNLLAGIITVLGVYHLARRLTFSVFGASIAMFASVLLLGSPLLEGNIANGENFFVPFIVWGLYFGIGASSLSALLSGLLFGLGFMIKFHPLIDAAALGLWLLLTMKPWERKSKWLLFVEKIVYLGVGFALPVIALCLYLYNRGSLVEGLRIIYLGNVGYTQVLENALVSQEARFVGLVLGAAGIAVLHLKKCISSLTAFVWLLLLFEFFASLLSGRRYKHYLIQIIPGLSLLIGYYVYRLKRVDTRKDLTKLLPLVLGWALLIVFGSNIFIMGQGQLVNTNPIRYYSEFNDFVSQKKSYFISSIDEDVLATEATLEHRYRNLKVFISADNPWYYDLLQSPPPISFIPAYHQLLRENGTELFLREVQIYNPDVILYEKNSFKSDEFDYYLLEKYVLDYEDKLFMYYVRRNANISLRY